MGPMGEDEIHLLITVSVPSSLIERVRAVSSRLVIHQYSTREVQNLPEELRDRIEILYAGASLPEPELLPELRWLQLYYSGLDHVIEDPLLDSDLIVTTMSGTSAPQMAEHALMGMLALGHRLYKIMHDPYKTLWDAARYEKYEPVEMRGSTVGVIGYGSVGREVARLCHAYGAEILALKHDLMHLQDEGYTLSGLGDPDAEIPRRIYPPQAISSMLSLCDFIVVTVPLTSETRGMIGEEVFNKMKPGAFLIDISRGGVVDHGALVEALNDGRIAGAALDVFPIEPLPESSPLWNMPNVILTPHIGGASKHYAERAIELFAINLHRYLADRPLLNRYDRSRGY
jgi:phosphoglycerate dehydrogenase-like enzyme